MYKKKIFYLAIILEILICYILLFQSITIYKFIYNNINKTYKILGENNGFIIEPNKPQKNDNELEKEKEIYNELRNNNELKVGLFCVSIDIAEELSNTNIIEKNEYPNQLKNDLLGKDKNLIPSLYINNDLLKFTKLNVVEGSNFGEQNLNKNEIPVLAGYNYKEEFRIGDTITLNKTEKYKIIGFLKKDEEFLLKTKSLFEEICNLNSFLVIQSEGKSFEGNDRFNELFTNLLILPNDKSVDNTYLKNIFSKYELNYKIKSFEDVEKNYMDRIGHGAKLQLFQVFILNMFVIFGLISVITTSIIRRQREFGVRFALGYTKFNIIKLIFKEFTTLVLIAYGLCLTYYKFFPKTILGDYIILKIDFLQAIILAGISIVLLLIIIIIISYKILKLEPHKLIGGEK